MAHRIKVLIFEDNRLLREGISALLHGRKDFALLAAPAGHDGSLAFVRRLKPEVILLDVSLPGRNSLHMVESISREVPKAGTIVMDLAPAGEDILRFIKAGASGFVLMDAPAEEFIRTLTTVASGGKVLPPLLSGSVFSEIVDHAIRAGGKGVKNALRMTKHFCSGLGHNPRRTRADGPRYLVTDLGQFDFANGRMRLISYHPGTTIAQIQARTGFELEVSPEVTETQPPSLEDIRLLRQEIDPLGIRQLESLSGATRRQHLHSILAQEQERMT